MVEEEAEPQQKILTIRKIWADVANFNLKNMEHLIHFKHLRGLEEEFYLIQQILNQAQEEDLFGYKQVHWISQIKEVVLSQMVMMD